ncbi:MAG: ParB/RepB/Spo0J family partition protein [Rhodobacteraceae bacterium]|nr:MAG: ParB/RepB/Spo0J family partition protein [Paracoccaceae bacterium]
MTDRPTKRRGLGRGLSALMADVGAEIAPESAASGESASTLSVRMLSIDALHPNPNQPRRHFAPDAMRELVSSISERGVLQPLIARPLPELENQYQIVAGERRWRAAQQVPLHEVPVILRDLTDTEVLEIGIIENIQREDLDPIEEAQGYRQLIDTFGHTQEKLAGALGKSRSYIANLLRLLQLPGEIQTMLIERDLSVGHARALITAADPVSLARRVVAEGMSVRQAEALARDKPNGNADGARAGKTTTKPAKDADTRVLESDLSASLGMGVVIDHRPGGEGRIIIRYKTLDQLDQLCQILSVR